MNLTPQVLDLARSHDFPAILGCVCVCMRAIDACVCGGLCEYLSGGLNLGGRLCMFYRAVVAYIVFLWRLTYVIISMQASLRETEGGGGNNLSQIPTHQIQLQI